MAFIQSKAVIIKANFAIQFNNFKSFPCKNLKAIAAIFIQKFIRSNFLLLFYSTKKQKKKFERRSALRRIFNEFVEILFSTQEFFNFINLKGEISDT